MCACVRSLLKAVFMVFMFMSSNLKFNRIIRHFVFVLIRSGYVYCTSI